MGIKDLDATRTDVDDIIAQLTEPVRDVFLKALRTRKHGTSRFFEVPSPEIVRECAADGYVIDRRQVDEWRRKNVD